MRELIKLKAVYEQLESITDRCEDVANLDRGHRPRELLTRERPPWTRADRFWVVVAGRAGDAFDFMNGFHDAANSIATVVSTGVLKPQQAVAFAAFFNVVAIFVFQLKVASTIGKGIVDPGMSTTTWCSAR
jgi:hypothetical protein